MKAANAKPDQQPSRLDREAPKTLNGLTRLQTGSGIFTTPAKHPRTEAAWIETLSTQGGTDSQTLDSTAISATMGCMDTPELPEHLSPLLHDASRGNEQALAELFEKHRPRLRRMVELRMDNRIRGRVSPSDVLQETYVDLAKQLEGYLEKPDLPFYVWMRWLTGQRLAKVHRYHLDAAKRDASQEIALYRGHLPQATSFALASKLIASVSSIGGKVIRIEQQAKLQEALNSLDEDDREVLAMRHFEQLTNSEVAVILEISESAATKRYSRALLRLKKQLKQFPDLFGDTFK